MERYVIHVTKKCNLNCLYCYEKDKTSEYTWEEIKSLIDNICNYNKEFSIEFLGGEPMLRFDLIKQTIQYLKTKEVFVNDYIITTNGTIINKELIDLMKENDNISFSVSIDGGYFANQLRITKDNKNSFDLVMKNIKELQSHGIIPSVHMVSHPFNVGLIAKSIDLFYNNNIKYIGVGIIESTIDITEEYCKEWVKQMKYVSNKIKNGDYKDLYISELEWLKPLNDKRYYIKDGNGKIIAETYGRVENDITKSDIYNSIPTGSSRADSINSMRFEVYNYHQNK